MWDALRGPVSWDNKAMYVYAWAIIGASIGQVKWFDDTHLVIQLKILQQYFARSRMRCLIVGSPKFQTEYQTIFFV